MLENVPAPVPCCLAPESWTPSVGLTDRPITTTVSPDKRKSNFPGLLILIDSPDFAHLSWSELFWSPNFRRLSVCESVRLSVNFSHVHLLFQNRWANFNQTWHKVSLGDKKGIRICSNEGPRSFQRGYNYEIKKKHRKNLKIFFSRTTRSISTKLGTKHLWVVEIQGFSNEASALLQGEIITK